LRLLLPHLLLPPLLLRLLLLWVRPCLCLLLRRFLLPCRLLRLVPPRVRRLGRGLPSLRESVVLALQPPADIHEGVLAQKAVHQRRLAGVVNSVEGGEGCGARGMLLVLLLPQLPLPLLLLLLRFAPQPPSYGTKHFAPIAARGQS
jgi:hypothetical protein